jgi:hypothetical protein
LGESLQEHIKALLWLQTTNGADDQIVRPESQGISDSFYHSGISVKNGGIDGIGNRVDAVFSDTSLDQSLSDLIGHGNKPRESSEQPFVHRVKKFLPSSAAGPAMNGGEGDHRLELGQEPGQEIGFVFMSVNNVDLSFADQPANGGPDLRIPGMTFGYLDIIDVQIGGLNIDTKGKIARVPEIANRDGESAWIGASGALQDGLLRPAAGAADTAKLQDANGPNAWHAFAA